MTINKIELIVLQSFIREDYSECKFKIIEVECRETGKLYNDCYNKSIKKDSLNKVKSEKYYDNERVGINIFYCYCFVEDIDKMKVELENTVRENIEKKIKVVEKLENMINGKIKVFNTPKGNTFKCGFR